MQKYAVRSDDHICVITGKFAEEIEERSAFCPIKAEILKNATNGDVIKAMFPNAEYKDRHNITIEKRNSENGELQLTGMADKEWWNSPWKGHKNADGD